MRATGTQKSLHLPNSTVETHALERHSFVVSKALKPLDRGVRQLRMGRSTIPGQIYHVIAVTLYRRPIFKNLQLGRIVVNCLRHEAEQKRAQTLCFVLMPDHLHWLMQLDGALSLSSVVNNVKAHSARGINVSAVNSGAVWQRGYFDHALRRAEDLFTTAQYIVANPVRAGLVQDCSEYALWDSIWL